jgi:hypothetical protein
MIRRALLVLALLCVAVPARASVLLIKEGIDHSAIGNIDTPEFQHWQVKSIMSLRGVTLYDLPPAALTTAGVKSGQFTVAGVTTTCDVVVHTCFSTAWAPPTSATYDPRTYGLTAGWPTKPHVWIVYPAAASGIISNVNNTDTTGIGSDIANNTRFATASQFTADGLYSWKSQDVALIPSIASATRASGIFRVIVGTRMTQANGSVHPWSVTDADSGAFSATTDSCRLWVRYRSVGDPAPMIYVRPGSGSLQDLGLIKMALQIADSASGGKVFENRARTTVKHSLILRRATSTSGDPASNNLPEGGGIRSRADSSAVAAVTARALQIAALGIKFSVGADPESVGVAANAALLAIFMDNCPLARVCLEPYAGTYSGTTTRASAAGLCIDPIGIFRVRTLFPFAQPTGIVTKISDVDCTSDSGSVFCGLRNGMLTLASLYPNRVDHVLMPSYFDWTPKQFTRSTGAPIDSLWAIFRAVGLRGVAFNPTGVNSNVGVSWALESGALPTYATAPAGWFPAQQRIPVRWGSTSLGFVNLIGARWEMSSPSWTWSLGHDNSSEHSRGAELGDYYPVDAGAYYKHNFRTGTQILALNSGELGSRGDPYPQSPTWYAIKWLTHEWMAENSLGTRWPDGSPKILDEWDYAENLTLR